MTWWGLVLIGSGATALLILILWLVFRTKAGSNVNRLLMMESENNRLLEEKKADLIAKEKIQIISDELENELREIVNKEKIKLENLNGKAAKNYRELADNPNTLLYRIDEITSRK